MGKLLKIITITGASVLNYTTILFTASLFLNFEEGAAAVISGISVIAAVIAFSALLAEAVLTRTKQERLGEPIYRLIRGLDAVSLILFFVYSVCFAFQTKGMVRGSPEYMRMMYPGLIPIVSGMLLNFSLKNSICG